MATFRERNESIISKMDIFTLTVETADDPESNTRETDVTKEEISARFPHLAPLVNAPEFYALSLVVGLTHIRIDPQEA